MRKIGRHDLLVILSLTVLAFTTSCSSCRRNALSTNTNTSNSNAPPFVAREPAQYRATRVTTYAGAPPQQTAIARDGDRSRIDFTRDGKQFTLIETPAGRILVSNDRAVFARLRPDQAAITPSEDEALAPDLSTARLLNQTDLPADYRRLRTDQFGGRAVTVFQVTLGTGDTVTESVLWIDDETSFPLKQELAQITGGVRQPNPYITEIRELIIGPPPAGWFDIPAAFHETAVNEFWKVVSQ
ncbi:MAG: hypothetical protein ABIP75_12285 [Pyrinomonadaceae bacterium]